MIKKYLDCTTCPQALKFIHHLARLYPWCSLQGNVPYCCPPEMLTSRRILQKTGFLYFLQRGQQREMSPKSNAQRCGMPCDLRLNPSRKFPTHKATRKFKYDHAFEAARRQVALWSFTGASRRVTQSRLAPNCLV